MDKKYLDEIKAREQAATPGPWFTWADWLVHTETNVGQNGVPPKAVIGTFNKLNPDFIAHARHDIPALVAEVERLQAAQLKAFTGGYSDYEEGAIEKWNRRPAPENKPLTLEQLREMDGEPVYIVAWPDWGHWELSADAEDYLEGRDEDFYGMTMPSNLPDPHGKYGLHMMGWFAYAHKPGEGK